MSLLCYKNAQKVIIYSQTGLSKLCLDRRTIILAIEHKWDNICQVLYNIPENET